MATPDQLIYKDRNPQADFDLPGVDPITPASFAPNGPPDPGVVQPPIQAPQGMPGPMESSLDQAAPVQPMAAGPAMPPVPEFKTTPLSPIETPQETGPIFSEYIKQSDLADQERMKNNLDKAQIHQKSADEQRLMLQHSDREWADAQAEQKRREANMDDAIAKGRAMSIDPQRYWNRAGTFSNILSAISVGLGSFASGMTHGATGNPGLTLVNNAIEHDIAAQKADIDNYWSSVKQQFQLDDTVFNRALANQNFRANQRLAALKIVDSELASVEAKSQNPLVQKGAAEMRLELQMKQIGLRQQSAVAIAEMLKQQKAAQAAMFTAKKIDADKRNAMVKDLVTAQVAQGIPADEAMRSALQQTDPLFPQLAGTQFASPGQQYNTTIQNTSLQVTTLNKKFNDKKTGDTAQKQFVDNLVKQGVPLEAAQKQMQIIKDADTKEEVNALVGGFLGQAGVTNPYGGAGGPSSSDPRVVADPSNPGQLFRFPSKEAAKEYGERAAAAYQFAQDADELIKLRQQHGGGFSTILNPDDAKREESIRQRMAGTWAKANGGGNALSDKEFARAMDIVPSASSYGIISDPTAQLQQIKQLVLQKNVANLEGLGGKSYGSSAPVSATSKVPAGGSAVPARSKVPAVPAKAPASGPVGPTGPTAAQPFLGLPSGAQDDDWVRRLQAQRDAIEKGGK